MAALISMAEYERLKARRADRFKVYERIKARTKTISAPRLNRAVKEALRAVRSGG